MSYKSLLSAVRTRLANSLSLPEESVSLRLRRDPIPPVGSTGRVAVMVSKGRARNRNAAIRVTTFPFSVSLMVRKNTIPRDREDKYLTDDGPPTGLGMDELAEAVKTSISGVPGGYAVIEAASTGGWVEPPRCIDDGGELREDRGDWLIQTMQFDGALRVQAGSGVN